jgi:glycerol-3-phosphate dehydrogenase (NAD(P)+)
VAVLTGPNLAREVAEGQPAASVVACEDFGCATDLQRLFMTHSFRVYTNPDVVGCEIAGALKNVIAIAVGIAAGLGYGDNAQAALVTRGLAEIARLGVALGGEPLTFAGLAGLGDLVATCTSAQSRNRSVGFELGRGRSLDEIVDEMDMVAEGVRSTAAVLELAARTRIEMPIATIVGAVLYDGRNPADLVPELMLREAKPELHGLR